ncbi:MAG: TrkH family potassium uptake protein [Acutalibacteraceae bacterium]
MNRRMVIYLVGKIIQLEAALMIPALITSFIYKEKCSVHFIITIIIALALGFIMAKISRPKNKVIYAKEGFVITALCWLVLSAIGALPFFLSGEIPSYIDAFFETVSGFTTTGASILTDIESLSRGILFWRSFTHWVGGMGVLVFVMAIMKNVSDRPIHILRAESPGPIIGKLVPKMKQSTRILYIIYLVLTLAELVLLFAGGMPLYDSIIHTFGTAGTGGFGIKADSIASYSPYCQWVITAFMLLFGVNFNIYFLLLVKKWKSILKSEELKTYFAIVLCSVTLIAVNIAPRFQNVGDAIRHSAFQVASIISTTGFSTDDFNLWPTLSKTILFLLMFIGACAGSTAGGLKVSRLIILFKSIKSEFKKLIHPRSVTAMKIEGKPLDKNTVSSVSNYLAVYCALYCGMVLLISFEPFDIETTVSAVSACFNNIGPALGAAGPASSYADFTCFSKIILSLAMLLGRLEIYPVILTILPSTWTKK